MRKLPFWPISEISLWFMWC